MKGFIVGLMLMLSGVAGVNEWDGSVPVLPDETPGYYYYIQDGEKYVVSQDYYDEVMKKKEEEKKTAETVLDCMKHMNFDNVTYFEDVTTTWEDWD